MDDKYMEFIALQDLTAYHYKILLFLNVRPYNQAALSKILNMKRQNIYKRFKELEARQLIEVDRIEGRNKFYKAVTNIKKIEDKI